MMAFLQEPGRFFMNDASGSLVAEVTFQSIDNGTAYALDHTFVDPSLRGQGIAGKLVAAVVTLARSEHKTIEPLCTYARHAFATHPEYADVLRPTSRH